MDNPQELFDSVWGEIEVISPAVMTNNVVSITKFKNMLSVNISDALIDLQGDNAALSAAWVGKFRMPLTLTELTTEVWYRNTLFLDVFKDAEAKATVVAILGDKTYTEEFAYGQAVESGPFHFNYVHQALALPAQAYEVTLLVVAERRALSNSIMVTIDGLDITVNPDLSKLPTIDKPVEQ